jgi:hypothetical protein
MVLVAVILPVIILVGSLALDVGDWYQQARHLQSQADAGALAGAEEFLPQGCQDSAIISRTRQYSGLTGGNAPVFNQIDGHSTGVSESINSQTYPGGQANAPAPETTPMTGSPCQDGMLDVKMTEGGSAGGGLPWYFQQFASTVGVNFGINAHARVSILQQAGGTGFVPLGLADPSPRAATAYFINESNPGTPLASLPLTSAGVNGQGQTIWTSNGSTVPVKINSPNVGVIIALSGSPNTTTCGQQGVSCFDTSPGPSLMHIQGYSLAGTGSVTAPLARQVTLVPVSGGCTDAYFAPNPGGPSCSFQVHASVDLGSTASTPPAGVTINAVVGGTSYPLTFSGASGNNETWTGTASLTAGTGSNQIDLQVSCNKNAANSVCASGSTSKTISDVQRAYAESATSSGPIQSGYVISSSGNPDQNSFEICETQDGNNCTYNLGVTITVSGGLSNTTTTNTTPYVLNYGSGTSASQTGSITCQPYSNGQFVQAVTNGCQGTYVCNAAVSAGTNCVSDSACANTNALAGQSPPPPADCVQTNTGVSVGQVRQAFTARITTPTNGSHYYCSNNWPTGSTFVSPPNNDSRYITMFITPYGSFGGSGQQTYPIEGFAEFYVVGWDGDPCTSDPTAGKGQVLGYFVQSITPSTTAIGGSKCTSSTFGPCVAVLTQ